MALPPTHEAASVGNVDEVLRLVHLDPQVVNSIDHVLGYTPLSWAGRSGHVSVVAALVDHEVNIDHQNSAGATALYLACYDGHVAVVEMLLEKGANPTLPTQEGWTPLMIAGNKGHVGIVARLLHHPSVLSTIDHCDDDGWTALCHASVIGRHEIVKMLLEAGADPTIRSNDGKTAMDITTEADHKNCVSLLKEWGRSYTITKARLLYDAFCRSHHQQHGQRGDDSGASIASEGITGGSGDGQASSASNKRQRVEATIPIYFKGRREGGQPLPKVEMVDCEEGLLVESVSEYVICGGLKGELFVELMELLGKTAYREEEEGV